MGPDRSMVDLLHEGHVDSDQKPCGNEDIPLTTQGADGRTKE